MFHAVVHPPLESWSSESNLKRKGLGPGASPEVSLTSVSSSKLGHVLGLGGQIQTRTAWCMLTRVAGTEVWALELQHVLAKWEGVGSPTAGALVPLWRGRSG